MPLFGSSKRSKTACQTPQPQPQPVLPAVSQSPPPYDAVIPAYSTTNVFAAVPNPQPFQHPYGSGSVVAVGSNLYQHGHGPAMASTTQLPAPIHSPAPPPVYPQNSIWSTCQLQQQQLFRKSCANLRGAVQETVKVTTQAVSEVQELRVGIGKGVEHLYDVVERKFNDVVTAIDEGRFSGREGDLEVTHIQPSLRGGDGREHERLKRDDTAARSVTSVNHFSKVYHYANSRLPAHLPPLKLYFATYPILCLAAQYARRVYEKPAGAERHTHIEADWRSGTKAMVIKSVPIDDMNTIVFAIRGTQSIRDWTVNIKTAPASPTGFLDDPGNLCHAGFLAVARKMVRPVADRLRYLLQEDPSRASCSLLITGHSAGGAVASLLYCHMLSESVQSELTHLRAFFKRVHCITFGSPPVSLLPLERPVSSAYRKSIFFSFINEGDPVPRADKAYVLSLLNLYVSPAPGSVLGQITTSVTNPRLDAKRKIKQKLHWKVPPSTLSAAGRLIVLRTRAAENGKSGSTKDRQSRPTTHSRPGRGLGADENVEACITTDAQLRAVVFGDPLMHMMDLYARRIEMLATSAVTVKMATD